MNPIVLLHGALGSGSQLALVATRLERQGRKIFTLVFSGHAGKPFSENGFGIEIFTTELLTFLNEKGIDQADVFGYSMGGYVALWFAHRHPGRLGKIVTLGTKFDWSVISAEREIKKMDAEKIELKVPAFAQLLRERHGSDEWKMVLNKTAAMMAELGGNPLLTEEVLRNIKSPVDILLGDQDDMADLSFSKQVAAWLSFGNFELLPNTPHPIEKVNTDLIAKKLLK